MHPQGGPVLRHTWEDKAAGGGRGGGGGGGKDEGRGGCGGEGNLCERSQWNQTV